MHPPEHGKILLQLARAAITQALGQGTGMRIPEENWLVSPGATFVTLTRHGQLRGCIGSLQAHRPLGEDVRENALAAAFRDPRFDPLDAAELADTQIEVSLLSSAEPMRCNDEEDVLNQLRPGEDGVIFEYGVYRSTFLPQVWEQLPTPGMFMTQLKRKAGLPGNFWAPDIRLSRYHVEKWKEHEEHA
jgi:AmmeMemoRadiSam system protein A